MNKFLFRCLCATLLLSATLFCSIPLSAKSELPEDTFDMLADEAQPQKAAVSVGIPASVTLDGKKILAGEALLINSVTYVPLRSFSELVGAQSITWNQKTATATVKKGNTTLKVSDRLAYIEANGRFFYSASPILNIDGRLYLPVRLICTVFCVDVSWDSLSRIANLHSTGKELARSEDFYRSDDLYWLSRIISAEAAGEPILGKIAVGNVVLNRRAHRDYPSTVYGVVFDKKHGTQFSPVSFGTIYKQPTVESIIAAKICLEGYSIDSKILFFMNPKIATSNWISKNRPFAFNIANHDFYY